MTNNGATKLKNRNLYDWAIWYMEQWDAACVPLEKEETPAIQWDYHQGKMPRLADYKRWFFDNDNYGIALICGDLAGRLVSINFSDPSDYHGLSDILPPGALVIDSQHDGKSTMSVLLRNIYPMKNVSAGTFSRYPGLSISGSGSPIAVPPTPGYNWRCMHETLPAADVEQWLVKNIIHGNN